MTDRRTDEQIRLDRYRQRLKPAHIGRHRNNISLFAYAVYRQKKRRIQEQVELIIIIIINKYIKVRKELGTRPGGRCDMRPSRITDYKLSQKRIISAGKIQSGP